MSGPTATLKQRPVTGTMASPSPVQVVRARPRTDAHEQEAVAAARRVVRGERAVLDRGVRPAPAASVRLPESPGVALAGGLRLEMETAIGADLGAVRIHSDPAAAAAARASHALAFAAGPDIFFAAGEFQPSGVDGRALLAHELTHVLQQTGRRASDDRLRATAATGPGTPQLAPGPGADYAVTHNIDFSALVQKHTEGTSDPLLDAFVARISTELGATLDGTTTAAADLEKAVLRNDKDYIKAPRPARAFLIDCLKLMDRFDGAVHLILLDPLLPTSVRIVQFEFHLTKTKGVGWFNAVTAVHPTLKKYWMWAFIDSIRQYLFGPTRAVPVLADLKLGKFADVHKAFREEIEKANTANSLGDNELVVAAFGVVAALDAQRFAMLEKVRDAAAKMFGSTPRDQLRSRPLIANMVGQWGINITGLQPAEFTKPLGEAVVALAKEAFTFWSNVYGAVDASPDPRIELKSIRMGVKLQALVPTRPTLATAVPKALHSAATTVFKLAKGDLPSETAYAAQNKAARQALAAFTEVKIELPLVNLVRQGKDPETALAFGWFLLWLHDFMAILDRYDPAADKAYQVANPALPDPAATSPAASSTPAPDVRVAHRIRVAELLEHLAGAILAGGQLDAWAALKTAAQGVTGGKQDTRSRVALLSDWTRQADAPVGQIQADFPVGISIASELKPADDTAPAVMEFAQLPTGQVVRLLLALYNEGLRLEIGRLLKNAPAEGDLKEKKAAQEALKRQPLLAEAITTTDARRRPVRWVVKDFERAYFAKDQVIPAYGKDPVPKAVVLDALVRVHPKTKAFLADKAKHPLGSDILWPGTKQADEEVFLWVIPNVADLIKSLRDPSTKLNDLLVTDVRPLAAVEALTPAGWLTALTATVGGEAALSSFVTARYDEQKRLLTTALRAAVAVERRLLVTRIKAAIGHFTNLGDRSWEVPNDVLDAIEAFGRWVLPREDEFAQIAALMLAIGPELEAALGGVRRYDVITGYYGMLSVAIAASEESKRPVLDPLLSPAEQQAVPVSRAKLEKLREAFAAKRRAVQARFGFKSEDGKELGSLVSSYTIKPNDEFTIDGDDYKLIAVHTPFTYNPQYGIEPLKGDPPDKGGYSPPQVDVAGEKFELTERSPVKSLLDIEINGTLTKVTSRYDNRAVLDQLSNAVELRANQLAMEALAETITATTEFLLDAAEFIPGAGQGLAAARIVVTIVNFVASGEFDEIKNLVRGDPAELIQELMDAIGQVLQPDDLWTFLLFGSKLMDRIATAQPAAKGGRRRRPPKKKGIAAALEGVRRIKEGFVAAMGLLYTRVQEPVHRLQTAVITRPKLAYAIGLIADNLDRLVVAKQMLDKAAGVPSFAELKADVKVQEVVLKQRLGEVLGSLAQLELPEKVIHLKPIAKVILTLFLRRFGAKGKAAAFLLEAAGLMDHVAGLIEDGLTSIGADPNVLWQKLRDEVEASFLVARDSLSKEFYGVFNDPPLSFGLTPPDLAAKVGITLVGEGFPDALPADPADPTVPAAPTAPVAPTQPFGPADPDPARIAALPPASPGVALPTPLRAAAEGRFGHDFGHVRLHTGADAAPTTGAVGAAGLTSGSHVYLRPGLSPAAGPGRRILDHELTHVLQQTGPRPLGERHDPRPAPGAPGQGLRVDPAEEAAAERVARGGGRTGGPLAVAAAGGAGAQPAFISTATLRELFQNLGSLTDVEKIKADRKRIEAAPTGTAAGLQYRRAEEIWGEVRAGIDGIKAAQMPARPNLRNQDVRDLLIKTYLLGSQATWIAQAMPKIVRASLVDTPVLTAKGERRKTPEKVLHIGNFEAHLRDFIMALSGVSLTFDLHALPDGTRPATGWLKGKVEVTNLVAALLEPTTLLWEQLVKKSPFTDGKEAEKLHWYTRNALRQAGATFEVKDDTDPARTKTVQIWDPSKFAFSKEFVDYVRDLAKLAATGGVDKASLPKFPLYANAMGTPSKPVIGVRVGTYGKQGGKGRESHHTTQYLLVEYFRNQTKKRTPFPAVSKKVWASLGVTGSASAPGAFKPPGLPPIEFEALDTKSRGDAMPAILLAELTHWTGDLHVKGEAAEDARLGPGGSPKGKSQGTAIDNWFELELTARGLQDLATLRDKPNELAAAVAKLDAAQVNTRALLHAAILATYGRMHERMTSRLRLGFPALEVSYYEAIEATVPPDPARTAERVATMEKIAEIAIDNNDKVMASFGWHP